MGLMLLQTSSLAPQDCNILWVNDGSDVCYNTEMTSMSLNHMRSDGWRDLGGVYFVDGLASGSTFSLIFCPQCAIDTNSATPGDDEFILRLRYNASADYYGSGSASYRDGYAGLGYSKIVSGSIVLDEAIPSDTRVRPQVSVNVDSGYDLWTQSGYGGMTAYDITKQTRWVYGDIIDERSGTATALDITLSWRLK